MIASRLVAVEETPFKVVYYSDKERRNGEECHLVCFKEVKGGDVVMHINPY
jgi:hypothetical protein